MIIADNTEDRFQMQTITLFFSENELWQSVSYKVQILQKKEQSLSNDDEEEHPKLKKKFGIGGVDRPQKGSWCPIHFAVAWPSKGRCKKFEVTNILES